MDQHRSDDADGLTGDPLLDSQRHYTSDGAYGGNGGPPLGGRQFLSYADLEERYGKSRPTIWRWVRSGRLPVPIRAGPNSVLFPVPEILKKEAGWKRVTYGPAAA